MREVIEASKEDGFILNKSETVKVCSNCEYDLTTEELGADTCPNCSQSLVVKTSVSVWAADRPR